LLLPIKTFNKCGSLATWKWLQVHLLSSPPVVTQTNNKDENCALLSCYAASSGHSLPTFRNNLLGSILKVQALKKGQMTCPET